MSLESLRQFRIAGYAVFDLALAFIGIRLLAPILTKLAHKVGLRISNTGWFYLTLPIGVFVHLLTGNITPMTEELLDPNGYYLIKALLVALVVLGIMEISKTEDQ